MKYRLTLNTELQSSKLFRGLDFLKATYRNHSFPPHMHETYVIGVIENGAAKNHANGCSNIATTWNIILVNPGEMHTGQTVGNNPWTYRAMYPSSDFLAHIIAQIEPESSNIPYFPSSAVNDIPLAEMIRSLLLTLERDDNRLELESLFIETISLLVSKHSDKKFKFQEAGTENDAVKRTKDYIRDNYQKNLSIQELSDVAYLSPYHLIRVFHQHVGLPPHRYLLNARIEKAKILLRKGYSISDVSYDTGFSDQSHFSRHFKQIIGVTPGQYKV